jgi:Phosphoesterase family
VSPPAIQRALAMAAYRRASWIRDVEHIVILMQENRSFDHYFGSLRGVGGFADSLPIPWPNALGSRAHHTSPLLTSCLSVSPNTRQIIPAYRDRSAHRRAGRFMDASGVLWSHPAGIGRLDGSSLRPPGDPHRQTRHGTAVDHRLSGSFDHPGGEHRRDVPCDRPFPHRCVISHTGGTRLRRGVHA